MVDNCIIGGGTELPTDVTNITELCTIFDLPNSPDEIGVLLPPANLRRIDFSALDFDTTRRAIIEYIKTYFPNDFNDFVASNGIMMITEITASNVAKLSLREDILANEAFLPTSITEEAVVNHLALINQRIKRQTPAVTDMQVSIQTPTVTDIRIPPGLTFEFTGPDGGPVTYELFRAPGDFESDIVIPAGKRGVIALGIEGVFQAPLVITSPGGPNQQFIASDDDILEEPVRVQIITGSEVQTWTATPEPLERFGPNDRVMNTAFFSDRAVFTFGDNINGQIPLPGQQISIQYRTGGGVRGRIGAGIISESRPVSPLPPATAPVEVIFQNIVPSSGGTDRESLEMAKRRAPRDFAVRAFASDRPASIVTSDDYAQLASSYSHPVFGSVSKGIATIRTAINANLVELFILAEGPDGLVTPSLGLKEGLGNYVEDYNVLTDSVIVLDGFLKTVDTRINVVVNKNADASVVRTQVTDALNNFFNTDNRDLGQALYVSDIYEVINDVDGVKYADIFSPADNILSSNTLRRGENPTESDTDKVAINEIIVEGERDITLFYEKGDRTFAL